MTTSTAAAHVLTTGVLAADDALTLLEQVVSENGTNYSIDDCVYFKGIEHGEEGSTPVCIVGHVLDKLGKTADDLSDLDNPNFTTNECNGSDFSSLGVRGVEITEDARNLLYEAQMQQDGNAGADRSWGAALDAARHRHANRRGYALLAA